MIVKAFKFSPFFFAILVSFSLVKTANPESTARLTVVIDGLHDQNSQVCLRIYSDERGFPLSKTSEVQSGCTEITGSSVTMEFESLKLGTYAVAVVDDENRDYQLNRDFLGIPQEGFGISNNPTVSVLTGMPKFQEASFSLRQDTKIRIFMKYSLDSS